LKTAKPKPAIAAKKIPRGLNDSTPFAVPTRMIPRTVTDVPRNQLFWGFSPRMKYATIAENVGTLPSAVTVAIAIPVIWTAEKNVS
jgi:uncharacterized protein YqcC (DUF446 family)